MTWIRIRNKIEKKKFPCLDVNKNGSNFSVCLLKIIKKCNVISCNYTLDF